MLRMPSNLPVHTPAPEGGDVEALVEEFLLALASGAPPDPVLLAARLEFEDERRELLRIAAAEEYLFRVESDPGEDLATYLARFEHEADRQGLREYVERSRRLGRFRPEPLAPGTLLEGRYRIGRELSSGGTAIIYLAQDEELGVERIVKAFNRRTGQPSIASGWEDLVRSEARTLAQLESRNIVTVHDILRDGERSLIVMDRVRGRDLENVLHQVVERGGERATGGARVALLAAAIGQEREGEFTELLDCADWYRVVARIVCRAAAALEEAHGRGVRHRDLKPANMLLVGGGEPVLLDFGFGANPATDSGLEQRLIGTPEYMAPEQFRERRIGVDPRTDVYQLGVLLQEFATLRRPFDATDSDFDERKRAGEIQAARHFDGRTPIALEAICRKATAGVLEERYASMRQLRIDLERFEAGKPPLYAAVSVARRALTWGRWIARKPAVVVGLAAAVLLVLGALMLWPSWSVPALTPTLAENGSLRYPEAGELIVVPPGGTVGLGLEVYASRASVLYAFEIYGDSSDGPRFIRPLPDGDVPWHRVSGRLGLPLLGLGGSERYAHEELLVFACERPRPRIERYIEELREGGGSFGARVPYDEARLLELPNASTRGVPLAKLSAQEQAALRSAFSAEGEELRDEDYAEAGIKPYRFSYTVQYQ